MNKGFKSIDQIIFDVMFQNGYNTTHMYPYLLSFALEDVQEFYGFNGAIGHKTKSFTLSNTKTIDLNKIDGLAQVAKIGVQVGDRTLLIPYNTSITGVQETDVVANEFTVDTLIKSDGLNELFYFYHFNGLNALEAYPSFHYGSYSYVPFKNEIQFSADFAFKRVLVEYSYIGYDCNCQTVIPVIAEQRLRKWLDYRMAKKRLGEAAGETQTLKYAWEQECIAIIASDMLANEFSPQSVRKMVNQFSGNYFDQ